jgi:hypothetical protein
MSSQDPRVEAIFHEALASAGAEREAFLAIACAGDASLREAVDRLLSAHEAAGSYFELPNSSGIEAELGRIKSEMEGERIGRYELLQEIGQGGFGTVWMAEQIEPVSRRVALKIIKMGMDIKPSNLLHRAVGVDTAPTVIAVSIFLSQIVGGHPKPSRYLQWTHRTTVLADD